MAIGDEIHLQGRSGSQLDVQRDAMLVQSADKREPFSWTSVTADIAGGETALLITNLSDSKHLHIVRAYCFSDVETAILFTLPAFGAFAGTAVVGQALNRTGITIAPATAYADETVNASDGVFARIYTNEATGSQKGIWIELDGLVKLGVRDSFGIDIVVDSGAFYTFVLGYFHTH